MLTDKKFAIVSGRYAEEMTAGMENVILYPETERGTDTSPIGIIRRMYDFIKNHTDGNHIIVTNSQYVVEWFRLTAFQDTDFFLAHKEHKIEQVDAAHIFDIHCEAISKLKTLDVSDWTPEEVIL